MSRDCLVALIALVLQFGLGMVLNLFITVPPADARAGFITEVRTAPLGLTLHALLGTLLICAAIVVVTRAIRAKDRLVIAFAATGLVAVAGAFTAGEMFVRDGRDGVSLAMALLTGVALVSYAGALARAAGTSPASLVAGIPGGLKDPRDEAASQGQGRLGGDGLRRGDRQG